MRADTALQRAAPDPDDSELASLELQVAAREAELSALKIDLTALQSRYLSEIGVLYAELATLEAAVAEAEIRAGLRPPPVDDEEMDAPAETASAPESGGCSNRSAPTRDLKKMFRDVARAVHPDLAMDERTRYRRHSLMAEANRAYAEQDEDRLRLILRAWEQSPDSVIGDDPASDALRVGRRVARLGDRLVELDAEFAGLRASAIARLKRRIDETTAQGWDLFAEMLREVRRDIARASARLASLRGARWRPAPRPPIGSNTDGHQ